MYENEKIELELFGSILELDEGFDEDFYEKTYPEVVNYFLPGGNLLSKKKRLFHHYLNFGKNLFKNSSQLEISIFGETFDVDEDFDENFYEIIYPEAADYFLPHASLLSKRKRLFYHYLKHGSGEGRHKNTQSLNGVFIKVCNGLANRLRTINSFYNFCKNNNKQLFVCWEEGPGFSDEKFYDFFDNKDFKFITNKEYNFFSKKLFNLDLNVYKNEKNIETYNFKLSLGELINKINNESFCYCGDDCLEHIFPNIFYNNYFLNLKLRSDIQEEVNKIAKNFSVGTVGVHIRRGDAWYSPWKDKFQISDDQSFIKEMQKEIIRNNANFFLSTDCEETQKKIIELFKDRIIINNNKKFFNSKDFREQKPFQKDAVVDLFLLSKTKKILGSYWSSYSAISAKIGQIKLKIIKKNIKNKANCNYDVSIVCAIKNREQPLIVALNSWLSFNNIKEIIIVDWSSDHSLKFLEPMDKRIKILRIEKQEYFHLSKAYNIGIKNSKCNWIMKMDAEYVLNNSFNFFSQYDLKKEQFLTGGWQDIEIDKHGFLSYLNGFIFTHKDNFLKVGGYNENLKNYGYDDTDLYKRMESFGLERIYLTHNPISIFHMPHSDETRSENYRVKDIRKSQEINSILSKNS